MKHLKWVEFIKQESQATKRNAMYILPIDNIRAELIFVGNLGNKRKVIVPTNTALFDLDDYEGNVYTKTQSNEMFIAFVDIVDNLLSDEKNKPLSANQGKILNQKIEIINEILLSDDVTLDTIQEIVAYIKANASTLSSLNIDSVIDLRTYLNSIDTKDTKQDERITTLESNKAEKTYVDNNFINKSDIPKLDEVIEGTYISPTKFAVNGVSVTPEAGKFYIDTNSLSIKPTWYVWTGTQYAEFGGGGKASEIENDSSVLGRNVKEALEKASENIGNSDMTVPSGVRRKFDLTNAILYFLGLFDKSADATFNKFLTVNNSGDLATTNGKEVLKAMPTLLTDTEKTAWKTQMNGGWTTSTMSVGLINPPVFKYENQPQWITLLGANLNLNPASFSVEIMNESGTVVLANVPNSQVQLTNSTTLVFWFNFYSLGSQKFKIRIWNGVAFYTTPMFFEQVDSLTPINFNSNLFLFGGAVSSPNSYKNSNTDANLGTDSNLVALGNNSIPVSGLFTDAVLLGSEDWTVTLRTREISYYFGFETGSQVSNVFGIIEGANSVLNENFVKLSTTNSVLYKGNYYLDAGFSHVFMLQNQDITSHAYIVTYIKRGSSLTKIRRKTDEQTTYITNDTIDTSKNYSVGCVKRNSNVGFPDSVVKFQILEAYKLN